MFLRFIHVVGMYQNFIPFQGSIPFYCMHIPHFVIHEPTDIWAVFTFINKATTNTHVEVFVHTSVFVSLGYILRSGIAGNSTIVVNFYG